MKVLSLLFCLVYLNLANDVAINLAKDLDINLANDLATDCGFNVNGKHYDLSGLQAIMPTDGFASSDGLSRMGMCGNNAHPCNKGGKMEESFVAVFGDSRLTNCVVMLAKWEKPTASALPAGSDGKIPDGILLKLPTGDPCPTLGSQPNYEVDVSLICDETTDSEPFALEQVLPPCTFGATMHTKHACPTGGAGGSSSGSSGLSGGSIFLIILLVVVIVYFAAGAGYQYKVKEASGGELVIHKDYWCTFIDYTRLGCLISFQFTKSKISECMNRDGNETVDEEDDAY